MLAVPCPVFTGFTLISFTLYSLATPRSTLHAPTQSTDHTVRCCEAKVPEEPTELSGRTIGTVRLDIGFFLGFQSVLRACFRCGAIIAPTDSEAPRRSGLHLPGSSRLRLAGVCVHRTRRLR